VSGAHAKFGFSGAHRWMECFGALALEEGIKDEGSTYADEGTAAHHVHAAALLEGKNASDYVGRLIHVTAETCEWAAPGDLGKPGIWTVTDEMAEALQISIDHVRFVLKCAGDDAVMLVEQRLDLSDVLGEEKQFSTGDVGIYSPSNRNLWIGDYKHGKGERVSASYPDDANPDRQRPNHQLAGYGLGWLPLLRMLVEGEVETVTLCVLQPRIDNIDEFTVPVSELLDFQKDARFFVQIIKKLTKDQVLTPGPVTPDAPQGYKFLAPGDKTCRWCKAKATCPALAAEISQFTANAFPAIDEGTAIIHTPTPPSVLTDEVLGNRYAVIDMVVEWTKAVKAEAERRVFEGKTITGSDGKPLKIVEGKKGNRAFVDEVQAGAALLELLPPDKVYPPQPPVLVSVSEAEKAIGKTKFKKLTDSGDPAEGKEPGPLFGLIAQAPGRPTIALGSDKRPPIAPESERAASAGDFGAVVDLAS
jgi:hypothetical protein